MVVSAGMLLATVATLNRCPFTSPPEGGAAANEFRSCDVVVVVIDLSDVYASGRSAIHSDKRRRVMRGILAPTCSHHASPASPNKDHHKSQNERNCRDHDSDNGSDRK